MIEPQQAQLGLIRSVLETLDAVGIRAWLFGGWGLDAQVGRITREHGDVEFWIERSDADRSWHALTVAGATAYVTQPAEESCEFEWSGALFSTAYFDRRQNGTFTTEGRWADWVFPVGSFSDDSGLLDGVSVPTMSPTGMLAMKEQYPRLRNGGPLRPKDVDDIATLRTLSARE